MYLLHFVYQRPVEFYFTTYNLLLRHANRQKRIKCHKASLISYQ